MKLSKITREEQMDLSTSEKENKDSCNPTTFVESLVGLAFNPELS